MSVSWPGNMRGPRLKTPLLVLLLLTALTHTVLGQDEDSADPDTETQDEETQDEGTQDVESAGQELAADAEEETSDTSDSDLGTTSVPDASPTQNDVTDAENGEEHGSGENRKGIRFFNLGADPESTTEDMFGTGVTPAPMEEGLGLIIIIIPAVLAVLIIAVIVCSIFIHRRLNSKTRHSEVNKEDPYLEGCSTEKVPMPMFEEDVPSVLELEMEELDDWMKKDG